MPFLCEHGIPMVWKDVLKEVKEIVMACLFQGNITFLKECREVLARPNSKRKIR